MELAVKIELLKNKLNIYIDKYGLNDKKTLKLSRKIDQLINKYNKKI